MEALFDNIGLIIDGKILPGFVFGIVHVSLVLIGFYTGWSINRLLKLTSKGYISGIIGASLAHVIADLVAALVDPSMRARTLGIVLGGLSPLLLIPFLEKYFTKSENISWLAIMKTFKKIFMTNTIINLNYLSLKASFAILVTGWSRYSITVFSPLMIST